MLIFLKDKMQTAAVKDNSLETLIPQVTGPLILIHCYYWMKADES